MRMHPKTSSTARRPRWSASDVGDEFAYTFDFGDDWAHRCVVDERVDPKAVYDGSPRQPVPVFGWGSIPDQYGRETADR